MEVGIPVEVVGVAVMGVGVLVLPHDRVAQHRHGPDRRVVDEREARHREVSAIVPDGADEPTEQGEGNGTEDASPRVEPRGKQSRGQHEGVINGTRRRGASVLFGIDAGLAQGPLRSLLQHLVELVFLLFLLLALGSLGVVFVVAFSRQGHGLIFGQHSPVRVREGVVTFEERRAIPSPSQQYRLPPPGVRGHEVGQVVVPAVDGP
mmetsp:Transcript_24870/g.50537  ORF Transcript_24870/g.50537 Transcript_24870/m.50537 type:complete len:206 (-) Transcript_24870:160-777(-)